MVGVESFVIVLLVISPAFTAVTPINKITRVIANKIIFLFDILNQFPIIIKSNYYKINYYNLNKYIYIKIIIYNFLT